MPTFEMFLVKIMPFEPWWFVQYRNSHETIQNDLCIFHFIISIY